VSETDGAFTVVVGEGSSATRHAVSAPDDYLEALGLGDADRVTLIEESFAFLLEREPKESIMRSFALPVIERYFPEYPDEIRRRMSGR
jgi:hypothetical protein